MRNKLISLLGLVTLFACFTPVYAQGPMGDGPSYSAGVYNAKQYSKWRLVIDAPSQVAAASPATFTLRQGAWTTPDGRTETPYVGEIVTIGAGSVSESVTLTAVSGCYLNAPVDSCTIAGNTSNSHGMGEAVTTASGGILEASGDAANHGGGSVYFEVDCGNITLSTSGATTTSSCNVPKTFTNLGASVYVTTTITTSASYSIGIASATTAWVTSCTALTAGTNCSQFVNAPGQTKQGSGTGALLITANATAGAGVVHVKVWGYIGVQSNS